MQNITCASAQNCTSPCMCSPSWQKCAPSPSALPSPKQPPNQGNTPPAGRRSPSPAQRQLTKLCAPYRQHTANTPTACPPPSRNAPPQSCRNVPAPPTVPGTASHTPETACRQSCKNAPSATPSCQHEARGSQSKLCKIDSRTRRGMQSGALFCGSGGDGGLQDRALKHAVWSAGRRYCWRV